RNASSPPQGGGEHSKIRLWKSVESYSWAFGATRATGALPAATLPISLLLLNDWTVPAAPPIAFVLKLITLSSRIMVPPPSACTPSTRALETVERVTAIVLRLVAAIPRFLTT